MAAATPVVVRSRFPAWLMAILLMLLTIALYWPATRYDFINFDDPDYVSANPHVQGGLNWEGVKWAFFNPVVANWHPLTMLSHMLDCQLFGLDPWGHHLINVLLHGLNAAMVFALLRQLTGAMWRSLLVAALFAVHPLHVESVAWVSERKDVFSGFFGLLTLFFYARYVQRQETNLPVSLSFLRSPFYWFALFFFALGLMSKPMLVTWPFVMLLLDYWPLERFKRCCMRLLVTEKIPFFFLAAAASFVTFVVQKQAGSLVDFPLGARVGNALISYCRYLEKMFWPTDLAIFYPHPGYWPLAKVLLAGVFLCGISVLLFVERRRYPFLLMGWLWFVGTLAPVIGLVQVGEQAMADRYTYIPSLGVLIVTIWGAYELTRRWRYHVIVLSLAGSAAIILCMAVTRQQLGYWKDSETLFRHALAVTEDNELAHNHLGNAFLDKGRTGEAIIQFQEAIRLVPDYAALHYNLGIALYKKGQTDEALRQFQEAVRLKPDPPALNNLAWAFAASSDAKIRNGTLAVKLAERACEQTHYEETVMIGTLAAAYAEAGRFDEAILTGQKACALASELGETNLLKRNRELVALYQTHQPYHEPPSNSDTSQLH